MEDWRILNRFILIIIIFIFLPYSGFAYCGGNYTTGDWNITSNTNCSNEVIPLNGNLTIFSSGNLTFQNVTLQINSSSDGDYGILVNNSGIFNITDGSNITNGDTASAQFFFNVNSDSKFNMDSSALSESDGLEIRANYANITESNFTRNENGIYLARYANYSIITNCTLYENLNDGILLMTSSWNTIEHNTIYNNSVDGIGALSNSRYNTFNFNTIYGHIEGGVHINNAQYNNFSYNEIYNNGKEGLNFENLARYNIALNNTFYNNTASIYFYNAHNNNLSDNTVYNSTYGIRLWDSNYNYFINHTLYNNTIANVRSTDSNNNILYNSTLSSFLATANDTYLKGTGNLTLVNTTFDKSKAGYYPGETANLHVRWYTWANVTNTSGSAMNNTNVTIYNIYNTLLWTNLTGADGLTDKFVVEEYYENISGRYNYTPFNITANKTGYDLYMTTHVTTTNTQYDIILGDVYPPIITLISPENGYDSSTASITFEYTVSDYSTIANCSLLIDNIIDQTDTSITKSTTQTFSKTDFINNDYIWSVNCTDELSNQNTSGTRSFTVAVPIATTNRGGVLASRLTEELEKKKELIEEPERVTFPMGENITEEEKGHIKPAITISITDYNFIWLIFILIITLIIIADRLRCSIKKRKKKTKKKRLKS